jgi:rhodanese-related sulfurtransferase
MKYSVGLALLAALSLTAVACAVGDRDAARSSDAASPQPVAAYVDVRTPEEFASGHVAGAINIPHDQMSARYNELAAFYYSPIVVYCQSGRRAGLALEVLKEKGFTKAVNGGGVADMRETGVPFGN